MSDLVVESIKKMVVNGNRIELPKEQIPNYPQVKKALIKAGGKYRKCGFDFTTPAQAIYDRLCSGEKIDDKKKFQSFATPNNVAQMIIDKAEIIIVDRWLEPSAGQGALADLAFELSGQYELVELMETNCNILLDKGYFLHNDDFLKLTPDDLGYFDKIIANPPFTKNQDIDHIKHMYSFLNVGGRLVSVASKSWTFGSQKKQVAFREWLQFVGAEIEIIPAGAFKESGTNIETVLITINN